jgi:acetyl-CoA C-acetyltransferase
MQNVFVAGIGQTDVGERWGGSLRALAHEALSAALRDAGTDRVDAVVVGNMLAGELCSQANLACLIADFAGLEGVEAIRTEAACGSGGAALRVGTLMVASGACHSVLVLGVEKMTDRPPATVSAALAGASDADHEALHGATFPVLNALMMQRYMHEHRCAREDFAGFSLNAHRNALANPHAMFRRRITTKDFLEAPPVAAPVHVLDSPPLCDGAAAAVLVSGEHPAAHRSPAVRVAASAAATDTISVATRRDLCWLSAVERSTRKAYAQAGITPADVDVFELHDAFTIVSALTLEAAGFAERGQGARLGCEEGIGLGGRIPISTMGGLKARGHPVGATGVYQAVEVTMQLRGAAGANQVEGARVGMCQSIGGSGASAFTHVLVAC